MLLRNEQNLLLDRDLAWLEFNRRVLKEAKDPTVPLLERVKFLAIFSSNLDEFFMVRVAGLKRRLYNKQQSPDPEDADVASALSAISQRAHELTEEQHLCFLNTVLPQLTAEGIHLVRPEEMTKRAGTMPGRLFPQDALSNRNSVSHRSGSSISIPDQSFAFVDRFAALESRFAFALYRAFHRQYPGAGGAAFRSASGAGRASTRSCCSSMCCAIICRAFTMASKSSPPTPSVSRATPNSGSCAGAMKIC